LGAFFLHAGSVDVGDCQVVAVGQGHQLDALRQLEVGQVNDLTDFNLGQVDFDEFRQVLRLAGNFDFVDGVGDFAALLLHANGGGFVDEVQRNVGAQLLAGNDTNEVGVHHVAFGRVALQGLDHHVLDGAGDVQGQHVAEGGFVFQQLGQFFGQQADGLGRLVAAVNYGGQHGDVTTQAAARTFPQVGTHFGIQGKISHYSSPKKPHCPTLATSALAVGQKAPRKAGRLSSGVFRLAEHLAYRFLVANAAYRFSVNRGYVQLSDG